MFAGEKHAPTWPVGCAGNMSGVAARFAGSERVAGRRRTHLTVYLRMAVRLRCRLGVGEPRQRGVSAIPVAWKS